jgi:hypothetical protein
MDLDGDLRRREATRHLPGRRQRYKLRNCTFVDDLKERLANRVQVTSDGHGAYLRAPNALMRDVAIPSISAHLTLSARTSRCGCLWTGGTVY